MKHIIRKSLATAFCMLGLPFFIIGVAFLALGEKIEGDLSATWVWDHHR